MSWMVEVPIFDGESEDAFKSRFVELSAQFKDHPIADICVEVFRGYPDANSRAAQASVIWGNSLELKVRIKKARDNKGVEPKELSKEDEYLAKCESEANNPDNPATVRYKWWELACKLRGFIKENADPKASGKGERKFPQMVLARYDD